MKKKGVGDQCLHCLHKRILLTLMSRCYRVTHNAVQSFYMQTMGLKMKKNEKEWKKERMKQRKKCIANIIKCVFWVFSIRKWSEPAKVLVVNKSPAMVFVVLLVSLSAIYRVGLSGSIIVLICFHSLSSAPFLKSKIDVPSGSTTALPFLFCLRLRLFNSWDLLHFLLRWFISQVKSLSRIASGKMYARKWSGVKDIRLMNFKNIFFCVQEQIQT